MPEQGTMNFWVRAFFEAVAVVAVAFGLYCLLMWLAFSIG